MKFGLSSNEFELLTQFVVDPLKHNGAKLWLFGSRARGTYQKFSDVDIMVECDLDLTADIGVCKEAITNSLFPYKVDIVDLKHFAKEYFTSFEAEKILL